MDTNAARRLIALNDEIKELDARLRDLKAEKDTLEVTMLDDWAMEGLDGMKLDGRTLFIRCDTYASFPAGKEAAIELLAESEHSDIVKPTVNTNTVSALVRELTQDGGELPEAWSGIIEAGQRYAIGIRKAA